MAATLRQLAGAVTGAMVVGDGALTPTGMAHDSRDVKPGFLFVAVPGQRFDGHDFVAGAVEAGASSLVVQADRAAEFAGMTVPHLVVPDVRRALAPLSCAFYDYPTRHLYLAGVTGTNGKTTTTLMIDSIARAAGDVTGTIGTLGATVAGKMLPHDRTTPEAPDLQRLFREMLDAGATSAAMEVASHALVIGRTEGCLFDVGVFTNLTQDHLDFHGTMEAYRDAKGLLFTQYADAARAASKEFIPVLNVDDPAGRYFYNVAFREGADIILAYGKEQGAIQPMSVELGTEFIRFIAKTPVGDVPVELPFGGTFNVANALGAIGYGVARGLSPEVIAKGLADCPAGSGAFSTGESGAGIRGDCRLRAHAGRVGKCVEFGASADFREIDCRFRVRRES